MIVSYDKFQGPMHTKAIFYTYIALNGGICGQRKEIALDWVSKSTYARYGMTREG